MTPPPRRRPRVTRAQAEAFVRESNELGRRFEDPRPEEIDAMLHFLRRDTLPLRAVLRFAKTFEPGAQLRATPGHIVKVGTRVPVAGGPHVKRLLKRVLARVEDGQHPYLAAQSFLTLHPLSDANGRTARALWAWAMLRANRLEVSRLEGMSFLRAWYLHSLAFAVDPRQQMTDLEV